MGAAAVRYCPKFTAPPAVTLKLGILMLLVTGVGDGDGGIWDMPRVTLPSVARANVLGA